MKTLLLLLTLCVGLPLTLCAGVRINSVGTTYTTIQAAITNASPGDFLAISTGVYDESVYIYNTELTLEGGYDSTYTNIIGYSTLKGFWFGLMGPGSMIDITNSTVILRDLEVMNGGFGPFSLSGHGGGIDARADSHVIIENCLIHENSAKGYGGGIYVRDSYLELYNSPVYDNITYKSTTIPSISSGGGIAVVENGIVLLRGSTTDIDGNWAEEGGGVWVNESTFMATENSDIHSNTAVTKGGGIVLMNNATGIVTDSSTIIGTSPSQGNSVTNGNGGGIYVEDSFLEIRNRAGLWHNYAEGDGGGVYMTNSMMLLNNGFIGYYRDADYTNYAEGSGGGVCMIHSHLLMTNDAYFTHCFSQFGGAVYAYESQIDAYDGSSIGYQSEIAGNSAHICGGVVSHNSSMNFHDSSIKDNMGYSVAGGVYAVGSGMYHFSHCDIINNVSSNLAGGIFAQLTDGEFILDATHVVSNHAWGTIGGICYEGEVPLVIKNGSRLSYNTAFTLGGMRLWGTAYVENTEISMNSCDGDIGAVYVGTHSFLECKDTDFIENYASTNGLAGALAVVDSTVHIIAENRSVDIMGNRAKDGAALYALDNGAVHFIAKPPYAINIEGNTALERGAGVWLEESAVRMTGNVRIDGNTAKYGAGIYATNAAVVSMAAEAGYMPEIVNNHAWESGAGIYALASNTVITLSNTFVGMPGQGNVASTTPYTTGGGGAAMLADYAELHAVNCQFIDNVSSNVAGGVFASDGSQVYIDSDFSTAAVLPPNSFVNNRAVLLGGAVLAYRSSRLDMRDALVISNSAENVGGIVVSTLSTANVVNVVCAHNFSPYFSAALTSGDNSGVSIRHSTFANNASNAIMSTSIHPIDMQNCIVWDNVGDTVVSNCAANFCAIQGGYPGSFNITNNPLFVSSANLNYQLLEASPCIDSGATQLSITNDCVGNPRPYDGHWDIGAYEFVPEPSSFFIVLITLICALRKK